MFKEIDISINTPSSVTRPMSNITFERGILEVFSMAEDLDIKNEHEKLFKDLKKVVKNYFVKGE